MIDEDRKLSPEEILEFIKVVSGVSTIKDIELAVSELKNKKNEEKVPESFVKENNIDKASIYDIEDLPLVHADLEDQKNRINNEKVKSFSEINEDVNHSSNPVLERKINNPWEGLRTVTPGRNN